MRHLARFTAFATAAIIGFSTQVAQAQTIQKGTLSGKITSASVLVPQATSVDVYTAPAVAKEGRFILTQVCVEDSSEIVLSGDTMGDIVLDSDDDCTTFIPGIAIPVGEVLTFTELNADDQSGMITGILSKK